MTNTSARMYHKLCAKCLATLMVEGWITLPSLQTTLRYTSSNYLHMYHNKGAKLVNWATYIICQYVCYMCVKFGVTYLNLVGMSYPMYWKNIQLIWLTWKIKDFENKSHEERIYKLFLNWCGSSTFTFTLML